MSQNPEMNPYHRIKVSPPLARPNLNVPLPGSSSSTGFQSSFFSKPDTFKPSRATSRFDSSEAHPDAETAIKKRLPAPAEPLPSVNLTWMQMLRQRLRVWPEAASSSERPIGISQLSSHGRSSV